VYLARTNGLLPTIIFPAAPAHLIPEKKGILNINPAVYEDMLHTLQCLHPVEKIKVDACMVRSHTYTTRTGTWHIA